MNDEYYEKCLNMPYSNLAEDMANKAATLSSTARVAYDQRRINEKLEYEKEQMELQHKLNKENIELQHSLNAKIIKKQLNLLRKSTIITATSTLVAALAGAYLAYALTQTQKPIQIKLDSEQFAQLRTATTASVPVTKTKVETSPYQPPLVNHK